MNVPEFRGVHLEFLADETTEIDLEGARFSGKSWVCTEKIIRSCLKYPGIKWLFCRYSDTETRTKIRPLVREMLERHDIPAKWNDGESCYELPEIGGLVSRIYCHGLKSQSLAEEKSKIRGLEVAGICLDQAEECKEEIVNELPFGTRQEGFPHRLIFAPNPPDENHSLCDRFPEECTPDNPDNPFPHRRYYRLSIADNAHNLTDQKKAELEKDFPSTHANHRALILGKRGPSETGHAVYEGVFYRKEHHLSAQVDPHVWLLESFDIGRNHPVWTVSQRTHTGGLQVLAGVMGKRMFLEDFLPIVDFYRSEWFDGCRSKVCCDPPPSQEHELRYTHASVLKDAGLNPQWRLNANAPDVRESVIQHTASLMRRRAGPSPALVLNNDASRFVMVSSAVRKHTSLLADGCESSYVWSPDFVSVGNKKVRQPKFNEWVDGWQRCLENTVLNFCAGKFTEGAKPPPQQQMPRLRGEHSWMG